LTSSGNGDCFIATSSLDGEKNLKKRVQPKGLDEFISKDSYDSKQLAALCGQIECEEPNKDLHSFSGQVIINNKYFTLSEKQFLLKGANLKNTEWIIGMCVYAGENTKMMLNSQNGR
jgi:phospholipid-transporting ATPase